MRSRKRSVASSRPLPEPVIFIERNLGKHKLAQALRDAGELVEVHDDHLAQDAPDEERIQLVGEKGWLAVTRDKNIRYRQSELAAIEERKARIFVIRAKNVTAEDLAEIVLKALERIKKFSAKSAPPFVAAIYRDGAVKPYNM
jgi:predicted nuclease of predicted toxin-antitoxin system